MLADKFNLISCDLSPMLQNNQKLAIFKGQIPTTESQCFLMLKMTFYNSLSLSTNNANLMTVNDST